MDPISVAPAAAPSARRCAAANNNKRPAGRWRHAPPSSKQASASAFGPRGRRHAGNPGGERLPREGRLQAEPAGLGEDGERAAQGPPADLPMWDPGLQTVLIEEHTVGGVCARVRTEVRIPGYAMSIAKMAAKQLHMHMLEAKLNTVIRYFAKTSEPSDAIEELAERASKGPFKAMFMRDYRLLVESLLSREAVEALGDLDWENSKEPTRLRQLMIDAVIQWAEAEAIYEPAFRTIETPKDPSVLIATVQDPNALTASGERINRALTIRVEGPAVAGLRANAGMPDFLDDVASDGNPYRDLQPHQILEFAPFKTFGLAKPFLAMEEFSLCISAGAGTLLAGSAVQIGDEQDQQANLLCSGGSELYQNLVVALAEYVENGMYADGGSSESRWVPSGAPLSLARLPEAAAVGAQCHALRFEPGAAGQEPPEELSADRGETILALDGRELGCLSDTVDCLLLQYPRETALSNPKPLVAEELPSLKATPKEIFRLGQMALVAAIAAGGALLLWRRHNSAPDLSPGGSPAAALVAKSSEGSEPGPCASEGPAQKHMVPANGTLSDEHLRQLCAHVEAEFYKRVLPIARPSWVNAGEMVVEYQVVVSQDGTPFGCRPVNGLGAHFYGQLGLADYKAQLKDIDRSSNPVVLKVSISNRIVEGKVDPDIIVQSWTDTNSLVFWGFLPINSERAEDETTMSIHIKGQ